MVYQISKNINASLNIRYGWSVFNDERLPSQIDEEVENDEDVSIPKEVAVGLFTDEFHTSLILKRYGRRKALGPYFPKRITSLFDKYNRIC